MAAAADAAPTPGDFQLDIAIFNLGAAAKINPHPV